MRKHNFLKAVATVLCMALLISGTAFAATPGQALDAKEVKYGTLSRADQNILKSMFNAEEYAAMNEDVVNAVGKDANKLFAHFIKYGVFEGRGPSKSFNVSAYMSSYGDLQKAFGKDIMAYYRHYNNYGKKEKRELVTVEKAEAAGVVIKSVTGATKTVLPPSLQNPSSGSSSGSGKPADTTLGYKYGSTWNLGIGYTVDLSQELKNVPAGATVEYEIISGASYVDELSNPGSYKTKAVGTTVVDVKVLDASSNDLLSENYNIVVKAKEITTPFTGDFVEGSTRPYYATYLPIDSEGNAVTVSTWESSDESVATVAIQSDKSVIATAVAAGTTTLTATLSDSTTITKEITVVAASSGGGGGTTTTTYSITNTLSNVTSSSVIVQVEENEPFSATLSAAANYTLTGATVTVTMGGTDITSTAYSNGTVSIDHVTGNVVITATAVPVTPTTFTISAPAAIDAAAGTNGDYSFTSSAASTGVADGASFTITATCTSVDAANTNGEKITVTYNGSSQDYTFTAPGSHDFTLTAATGQTAATASVTAVP